MEKRWTLGWGRGASGEQEGVGPEGGSVHPPQAAAKSHEERPMQSGGARGLSRETIQTLFPMTLAALEKKKKGEKKSVNPQSAQLSKPNGRLPKAARSEALALIPQPTEKKIKNGVSSGELIARVLLSRAASLPPPHEFWAVPHYLAYLSSQSSHKQLWLTTPLPY